MVWFTNFKYVKFQYHVCVQNLLNFETGESANLKNQIWENWLQRKRTVIIIYKCIHLKSK